MIKRILIPLDPSPYTETSIDIGCFIAKKINAELTGMAILDIPGILNSIGPMTIGGSYYAERLEEQKEKDANERVKKLLAKFKDKCQKEGVRHRESEFHGSPSDRIIHESIYYNLIIVGLRTFYHFEITDRPGRSLEDIMNYSITPILGVPEFYTFPEGVNEKIKVLIAFDGSLPSARALHRFAELAIPEIMEVTLLNSDQNEEISRYILDQAETFLKSYSITNIKKVSTPEKIIKTIEENYLEWADIVVVGRCSKNIFMKFMVGSLTRHLITLNKKPILIGE